MADPREQRHFKLRRGQTSNYKDQVPGVSKSVWGLGLSNCKLQVPGVSKTGVSDELTTNGNGVVTRY